MTSDEVKKTLRRLIAEICGVAQTSITDDTAIDRDLDLPSVAFIELQVAVEDAFDIVVDPLEMIELNTFRLIAEGIFSKVTGTPES